MLHRLRDWLTRQIHRLRDDGPPFSELDESDVEAYAAMWEPRTEQVIVLRSADPAPDRNVVHFSDRRRRAH
jgi:hypothetical protein